MTTVISTTKNIEAIYPLSSMQQAILFHELYKPEKRAFFIQFICTLTGNIDTEVFRKAWQLILQRHAVLRTAFVWENVKNPLQIVQKEVELPWTEIDRTSLSPQVRESMLERLLQEDRDRGFEISKAPLTRVTLLRDGEKNFTLLWSHHHLLIDGWCLSSIWKEVLLAYDALIDQQPFVLPVPRPYKDFITWLQGRDGRQAEKFWRTELKDLTVPTVLDLGKAVRPDSRVDYEYQTFELSATLTEALQSFARQNHLTLATLFQGVWAILLSRYSGQTDVLFGTLVSGRPTDLIGVETMIGMFFNTLPTRVHVEAEMCLKDWLVSLQKRQIERQEYCNSSFSEIQGWSAIPRSLPLFESVVAFQNYPIDRKFLQGNAQFDIENIKVLDRSDMPLTFTVIPREKFCLQLEYYTDRFTADTITRMMGHLRTLLEAITISPQKPLARLPWLTNGERDQILGEWNNTARDYPLDRGLYRWFEEQVERTPEAIALRFEREEITYRELNGRANQLAHHLQDMGIGTEAMVGVLAERSLEMVIALLAILKAGGAYVPLDPELPSDRLAYLIQDSGVKILLAQEKWLPFLTLCPSQIFCLDRDQAMLAHQSTENLAIEVRGDHLAYTIYTSGSTGKPKGAMNTHRGIVNRLLWMQEAYGLTADDRVLQKTPFGFDVSVWEFFWPLMTGALLVLALPGGHRDSGYLVRTIERERITTLHFVPSMLQVFLEEPDLDRCSSLRRVICSGEALSVGLQRRFFERLACGLHNLYGPTEAAIDVTHYTCQPDLALTTVPIGRPIANTRLYILDSHGQPVSIGVKGELYIGGVGLAKGYLNRPELTREKFIPDPFCEDADARLYKTGDLARYSFDGNIEYIGRMDNQIKLRGFRIEIGEIEATLNQFPKLREAVVLVHELRPDHPTLVAYVVALDVPPDEEKLRLFLQQTLPDYMLPSVFVWLEQMPVTVNGKLDRFALPVPDRAGSERVKEYVPPRTPVEETIASLVCEVLEIERVGSEDSFFELGGHSLSATRLVSRLRSTFKIEFTVRELFETPTVKALAQKIETSQNTASPKTATITRVARQSHRLTIP